MKKTESTWILLCDMRAGRLLQAHQTALGTLRLEEVEQRFSTWVDVERHRPAPVSTCGVQDYGTWDGVGQEQVRFRVRELMKWLRTVGVTHRPDNLLVVAPGTLGGTLRARKDSLRPLELDIVLAELSSVPTPRLGEHKVVKGWLEYARAARG